MRGKKTPTFRIGVFLSTCEDTLKDSLDFEALNERIGTIPGVVFVALRETYADKEGSKFLTSQIGENNLDRVVIASGTPRTLENVLLKGARDAGLEPYHVDIVNIREQCCYPHLQHPEADQKAYSLIACGIARMKTVAHKEASMENIQLDNKDVLIIGGGVAGITAAQALIEQGIKVHLVERNQELGGLANDLNWDRITKENNLEKPDIGSIEKNENLSLHLGSAVKDITGTIGNYYFTIAGTQVEGPEEETDDDTEVAETEEGKTEPNESSKGFFVGAVIIATGSQIYDVSRIIPYRAEDSRVIDFLELESMLKSGDLKKPGTDEPVKSVAGSRDLDNLHYCSLVCCTYAISQARWIKEVSPETDVYVHYMDLRGPYNGFEEGYLQAQKQGVRFVRGRVTEIEDGPESGLLLRKEDLELGDPSVWEADLVVLSAGQVPSEGTHRLAEQLDLVLDVDGFPGYYNKRYTLKERMGITVAGTAQGPRNIRHAIQDGKDAAREVLQAFNEGVEVFNVRSQIDRERCVGCGVCEAMCPYQAITLIDNMNNVTGELRKVSEVNLAACQGCGACAMACPSGVPTLLGYSDQEVFAQIDELI
jgi:heterodisulfide reductase subunit A